MKALVFSLLMVQLINGERKFLIPNLKINWHKAVEFCITIDMRLASIENKAKSDAIEKFVRESDKFANVSRLWIGASDLAEEGTFTWIHNGDNLAYTHWNEREPNNNDREENCVELTHHTGTWFWNDMNCEYETFLICQQNDRGC
uniref:Putative salivary c-type lectin n=1 Tax=Aedes albopictus TaxID=7160 RepID=A0A1W7R8L6_AEDAL